METMIIDKPADVAFPDANVVAGLIAPETPDVFLIGGRQRGVWFVLVNDADRMDVSEDLAKFALRKARERGFRVMDPERVVALVKESFDE